MRPLDARERALLLWCAQSFSDPDRAALREQTMRARVTHEEGGHVVFEVPLSSPAVLSNEGLQLYYSDPDGTRVDLIISFVCGRLSWIDRYRITGGDPELAIPAVDQAHFY